MKGPLRALLGGFRPKKFTSPRALRRLSFSPDAVPPLPYAARLPRRVLTLPRRRRLLRPPPPSAAFFPPTPPRLARAAPPSSPSTSPRAPSSPAALAFDPLLQGRPRRLDPHRRPAAADPGLPNVRCAPARPPLRQPPLHGAAPADPLPCTRCSCDPLPCNFNFVFRLANFNFLVC